MINTFAQIDHLACAGQTAWHRASALAKLLLAVGFVLLAVLTPSWGVVVALLVAAIAMTLTARIPLRLIAAAASTPVLFAFIFAMAHWAGGWADALMLLARPMTSGLVALWLIGTTPYPDLFAPVARVLPRNVGDSLFLSYRAVFALLARVERLWKALFLRGALLGSPRRRVAAVGEAVGTVVLSGFDRSERLYQTMLLRGHSGRICGCRHWMEPTWADLWVLLPALWAVAAVLTAGRWRLP